MLSINTNLAGLIAQNSMKTSTNKLNQAIERMTTGLKINHARDNAANYSIATNMTTRIGSYQVAEENASMGLDMILTAEGNIDQIQNKLQRLRDLQEQASNGTYGTQSLFAINTEANALVDEINRIYNTAEYNGIKIFGQSFSSVASNQTQVAFALTRGAVVTYAQYADDYLLGTCPNSPDSHIEISLSDGTILKSSTKFKEEITWGDLSIPTGYTWSEEKGCFLNSFGEELKLIIDIYNGESIHDSIYLELSVYGIENVVSMPDPDPTPDPDPDGGGGSSGGGTTVGPTGPTYSPDSIILQVGVGSGWSSQIGFSTKFSLIGIEEFRNIGIDTTTDFLSMIDEKLLEVSEKQTELGAVSNRLESVLEEISTQCENLISSRSTLRDADIVEVSSEYIRQQILQQASATLIATANQAPAIALQLI